MDNDSIVILLASEYWRYRYRYQLFRKYCNAAFDAEKGIVDSIDTDIVYSDIIDPEFGASHVMIVSANKHILSVLFLLKLLPDDVSTNNL